VKLKWLHSKLSGVEAVLHGQLLTVLLLLLLLLLLLRLKHPTQHRALQSLQHAADDQECCCSAW
jgi:hypothetical protein